MGRKHLIAGNWKMNKTEREAISLVRSLMREVNSYIGMDILICPPFTALSQLHKLLVNSPIQLGAQNISEHTSGAYTGEISSEMVAEFCTHVILGHSERRLYYGETDDLINKKIRAAQKSGLIPILCVGETLDERDQNQTDRVVSRQLTRGLFGVQISDASQLVIAYEPVWAIGTGRTASPPDTSDLIGRVIRATLLNLWGTDLSQGIRVLYGGSVKPGNAGGFFSQTEIDGALVGGASLTAEDFLGIVQRS